MLRVDPPHQTPAWALHHGESRWIPVWGRAAVTVWTYRSWTLSRSLQLSRVWLPYLLSWNSSKHEADHTVWQRNSRWQLMSFTNRGCDASMHQCSGKIQLIHYQPFCLEKCSKIQKMESFIHFHLSSSGFPINEQEMSAILAEHIFCWLQTNFKYIYLLYFLMRVNEKQKKLQYTF